MRVIARSTLSRFIGTLAGRKDRAAVKAALDAWYYEVKSAAWSSPAEVKRAYANASGVHQVAGIAADYDRIDARTEPPRDQT